MQHLDNFTMRVREYPADEVWEFDSIDELQNFDEGFLNNVDSTIIDNITSTLKCSRERICKFAPIKKGMTNTSFSFEIDGKRYVYRHPGKGTAEIINRASECFSQQQAYRLGLDKTFIKMDSCEGWKISHYVEHSRDFDYHNSEDVKKALRLIRILHESNIRSEWEISLFAETEKMLKLIEAKAPVEMNGFDELRSGIRELYALAEQDGVAKCLCHVDCYAPNFLTDGEEMYLIDWEYSGNSDPASDIGTMICCSDYDSSEVEAILELYFGRKPSALENRHWKAYVAISAYYWFVWALYKESVGCHIGEFLYIWYRYAQEYLKIAMPLYKEEF